MKKITPAFLIRSLLIVLVFDSAGRPRAAEAAKILNIAFTGSKSHKITYEPLLYELAKRGHEVTSVGPFPGKDAKNFRNILTLGPDEMSLNSVVPSLFEKEASLFDPILKNVLMTPLLGIGHLFATDCYKSYQLPQVQGILEEKFDLIIFTPFFNECLYGLIHKLNTTVILFTPTQVYPWIARSFGAPEPPSFVPNTFSELSDRMCFTERLLNYLGVGFNCLVQNLYYYPMVEKVYREGLNDPDLPSVREIEKSVPSLVFSNSHPSFSRPRPILNDVIEVGGLHLRPAKPVPKELDTFLNEAKDGFILFSMGSALKGSLMPESYRKLFLNVFSKLQQRVLWKWETETMEGLPPNVKLSKWLPQQDVLGHKNIRLFITHGGHGGIQEAIYHAVPLLGIPMFGDQPGNIRKAAELGIALPPLAFGELTEEILLNSINEAVNNASYKETVKKLSTIFLDQPQKPLDRAVYWTEYILRHKGAPHLRSAGRDLNFFQYHSLDVLAVLIIAALISLKVAVLFFKGFYLLFFWSDPTPRQVQAKGVSKDKKKK